MPKNDHAVFSLSMESFLLDLSCFKVDLSGSFIYRILMFQEMLLFLGNDEFLI